MASDVGGHKELIRHGETGWLFKADDRDSLVVAILDMLDHRERWPQLRANGRRFVESVRNWFNSVAHYEAPYQALLKRGNR